MCVEICHGTSLMRSDMARVQQGNHIVLPATHTRTIPGFIYFPAARRHLSLAGTHCASPQTDQRDGQAELT